MDCLCRGIGAKRCPIDPKGQRAPDTLESVVVEESESVETVGENVLGQCLFLARRSSPLPPLSPLPLLSQSAFAKATSNQLEVPRVGVIHASLVSDGVSI